MSSRFALCAFFVCAVSTLFPAAASAQATEILATGPDAKRGIPYLAPNILPYFVVTYRTARQEGSGAPASSPASETAPIRVLFTETPIVPYSDWKPSPCGGLKTLEVQQNPPVLFIQDSPERSLFFVFPPSYPDPCSFTASFVARFNYFLGVTQNSTLSSFPAVLQIP